MKFIKENFPFFLIIVLSIILRFTNLAAIPVGFNDDEAAFGYNAYSIAKTAKDEWGRFLPFPAFESFGDWKLVGYLYLTVLAQQFLGVNEFATRFPSALFGVLTVIVTYFLANRLFDKKIAIVSSLLLATSPWHIVASRNAFESDLLSFFITLAVFLFLLSLASKRYFVFSLLTFIVSFYFYRSAWIFVPPYVAFLLYSFRHDLRRLQINFTKVGVLIFLLILPLIPLSSTFRGQSRFFQESFIAGIQRVGINNEINEKRGVCQNHLPVVFCTFAYNKYLVLASTYINNYLSNLSPKTYFDMANPLGFQSFMSRSAFYFFELPLILSGIILLLKQKNPAAKILIPWLLLSPVGAAIAGSGNFGRINLIMPAPQIIASYALISLLSIPKSKLLKTVFISASTIIIFASFSKFLIDLFYLEPFFTSRHQRYGYKVLFNYLHENDDKFDKVYISKKIDNSHQYVQYLFFQKIDPVFYQKNSVKRHDENGWIVFDNVGKYYFVPSMPAVETIPERSYLVIGEGEVNYPVGPLFVIKDLRNDPIFEIYDARSVQFFLKAQKLE